MKTSNKVLTGFFIIIFLIPVFILLSFNSKIRKGEFTVVKNENGSKGRGGSIAAHKVIKITGPGKENVFSCTIIPADSASYTYPDYYGQDDIKVEQKGDTLWVKYTGAAGADSTGRVYQHSSINLHLPVMENIIIDGADVLIDSINGEANPQLFFQLNNRASIEFGSAGESEPIKSGSGSQPANNEQHGMVNSVKIKADNASITVGPNTWIANLDLQVHGASKVNVDNNSRIGQVSGFISDSSTVGANWKNIKRLAALSNQ
jgi:hypothetical protein